MEYSLTLEELVATLEAIRKKEEREFKFHAAVAGIEYGESAPEGTPTFEEIWSNETDVTKDMPEPERLAFRGIGFETVTNDG